MAWDFATEPEFEAITRTPGQARSLARLSIRGGRGQGHAGNPHERLVESSLFSVFNLPHNPCMGPVTHDAV